MAWTDTTTQVVEQARVQMGALLDDYAGQGSEAWQDGWDQTRPHLHAAVEQLAADYEGWPGRSVVARDGSIQSALIIATSAATAAVSSIDIIVGAALPTVAVTAADATRAITATQLPAVAAGWTPTGQDALEEVALRASAAVAALTGPLPAWVRAQIEAALTRGVSQGLHPRAVVADIMARVGAAWELGKSRAETIARTELMDAYRAAAAAARAANPGLVAGWRWDAALDARTCIACLEQHGSIHPATEPGPDGHQRCRCSAAPVAVPWTDLGIDGPEPESVAVTGEDWFAAQDADVQRSIMGPARHSMWSTGQVQWGGYGEFVEVPGWRRSLRVAPVSRL